LRNRRQKPIGLEVKNLRRRLGLTIRDVETSSRCIARKLRDPRYSLAASVISDLENHSKIPSVFKIFSLSLIYNISIRQILHALDFDVYHEQDYSECLPATSRTRLVDFLDPQRQLQVPFRFDPVFTRDQTSVLNRMIQEWSSLPWEFFKEMDFDRFVFAYIGEQDNLLYPLFKPGAIVKIDTRQTRISAGNWRHELERPVYLVTTPDGYRCCWCVMENRDIILLPHALSQKSAERYKLDQDASVMGQAVGFWQPLTTDLAG
jgi:hypothetical protein